MTAPADPTATRREVEITAPLAGERLDRALVRALGDRTDLPALSRSRIKTLIESGRIALDGRTISEPSRRVKPGERYTLDLPEAEEPRASAQAIALDVLYEDDDVIVVDKPAGLVVHPAPGNPDRTLVNALLAHCGDRLSGIGGVRRPGIVHRLDKDTSGILVAAKNDAAHHSLARQFADRTVERAYVALVWGTPRPATGEISGAIGRSRADRKKMAVVRQGGKAARTRYRVLRSFLGGAVSEVECRLATGRTHQIRVHLASIGHPLVGDPVYGRTAARRAALAARHLPDTARAALGAFPRQALDAVLLAFVHPRTAEPVRFQKNCSSDIRMLMIKLDTL